MRNLKKKKRKSMEISGEHSMDHGKGNAKKSTYIQGNVQSSLCTMTSPAVLTDWTC